MTELTVRRATISPRAVAAVLLAVGAMVSYALALSVDDGMYTVCGLLGIGAYLLGRKARRAMDRGPARAMTTLAATVGAIAGAVVIVCSIVVGVEYLA